MRGSEERVVRPPMRASSLPRSAWMLRADRGGVYASCGSRVACEEEGFFEGSWSSVSHPRELRPEGIYLGSGAYWANGVLRLIAPTHTCEAVYVGLWDGGLAASNSLAGLLAVVPESGFRITEARRALETITHGLGKYERRIHVGAGVSIFRFAHSIITATPEGLIEMPHRPSYEFHSYSDYRDWLNRVLGEVHTNLGEPDVVTFLSRGYDSVACAALAKGLGNARAISIDQSRNRMDDDGAAIAEALGIPAVSLPRRKRPPTGRSEPDRRSRCRQLGRG